MQENHDHREYRDFWPPPWFCVTSGIQQGTKVRKIIINDTINLFLTAISILVISNHNSYQVLFDKIASIHFIWKIYFSTGNGQSREPALCQLYRHTFVPYARAGVACLCFILLLLMCTVQPNSDFNYERRVFTDRRRRSISLAHTALSSKPSACHCCCPSMGQTDGRSVVS